MSPSELKVLILAPSIKNWPFTLGTALLSTATGLLGLVLLIFPVQTMVLLVAAGMAALVFPALHTANTEYWVTNVRVVVCSGLFSKSEYAMPLEAIKEMHVSRTRIQKNLGVGDLDILAADGTSVRFSGIESPEAVRDKILTLT